MVKLRHAVPLLVLMGCTAVLGIDKSYILGTDAGSPTGDSGPLPGDGSAPDTAAADGGSDGGPPPDGSARDAGCTGGHICNGVCLPGTSCASCATGQLLCPATGVCVAGCTACTGTAIECFRCPDGGAGSAEGTCEPTATAYCLGGAYAHCPCSVAANCPGGSQTCSGSTTCQACGEGNSDGAKCKNGLTCSTSKKRCE